MTRRTVSGVGGAVLFGLALLVFAPRADALGLRGLGVRVGVDLARETNLTFGGTEFDTARLVLGGHLDMGRLVLPKMRFVPGMDVVIQENLKIYSINPELRYQFFESEKGTGYFGGGIGVHLYRYGAGATVADPSQFAGSVPASDQTKISLNVPLGFQRKLGEGLLWFGEMKMVIADEEIDSSFRFSVGLAVPFGK